MAVKKSPGQKRKRIVQIAALLLFVVTTYFAGQFVGNITSNTLAWTNDHSSTKASVTELVFGQEEYRNRKGRKRTRDVYSVSYQFNVDGEGISNTVNISASQFNDLEQGGEIDVWYSNQDLYLNDTKENVTESIADNTTESNMFDAAVYTAPVCLFLYWLLSLIFVRESKKSLPEGFYTETSWLDVDDKYMVALDGSDLVYFDIDKNRVGDVQEAYQNNADLEELIGNSKSSKLKRIPLGEISQLSSDHNSDVISIEYKDDSHSIEFLNQTVKAHALERIIKHIPASLSYSTQERTRLQAATPSFIWLAILATVIYFVNIFVVNALIALYVVVSVLPKIVSRLLDPTITQNWLLPETQSDTETEAEPVTD